MIKVFFDKLVKNRMLQWIFFTISMLFLFTIYLQALYFIEGARDKENAKIQSVVKDFRIVSDIEEVNINDGLLYLKGWAMRYNSTNSDIEVVFESTDGTDICVAVTKMLMRKDVNALFYQTIDFGKCGFVSKIKEGDLEKDACYEVCLVLDCKEEGLDYARVYKKIFTGKYFFAGKLYNYNPITYEQPQIVDEKIAEVIRNGRVCFFDQKSGCWVYFYKNQLYLIINDDFGLVEDEKQIIKYHVHTMQTARLPEKSMPYGYESKDFFFAEKEYALNEESAYRVAIIDLPEKYEASWIEMGLYRAGETMFRNFSFPIMDLQ